MLFLFALVPNVLNAFLGVLIDAWVASSGAFDHVYSILKRRPRLLPATTIASKRAFLSTARPVGAIVLAVVGDGLFHLTGIDLGSEGLTAKTTSL